MRKKLNLLGVIIIFILTLYSLTFYLSSNNDAAVAYNENTDGIIEEETNIEIMENEEPVIELTFNENQGYPDLFSLEREIETILKDYDYSGNFGVYMYDLSRDKGFNINGDTIFPSTSLSKIPIAILALRDIDQGKHTLDTVVYGDTLSNHISNMIIYSDNDAMMYVEWFLGGWKDVNERIRNELGIDPYYRYPYEATAENVGEVLKKLYDGDLLNSEYNNYLINLLKNTAPYLQDRIPTGIPDGIDVAHKIGQDYCDGNMCYNDAGIIFGKSSDFILVFMNEDVDQNIATDIIIEITEIVYDELN